MSFLERILLLIYFPQFNCPNESRFESLFLSILKKENSLKRNISKSIEIFPEKIIRNEDKRTSLLIKGIPNDVSKDEIKNIIEKYGNINYLYIIKDTTNKERDTSIAYINVINYKSIISLFMNLRNLKFERNGKIYKAEIMYSNIQGKQKLGEYIRKKYCLRVFNK